MKAFGDIRVLPVVLTAVAGLVVLKVAGLVLDGGYVLNYPQASAANAKRSWAEESLNFPTGRSADPDITGSFGGHKEEKPAKPEVAAPEARPAGTAVTVPDAPPAISPSERAVLERLQARRQELDARAREIDIRENLLKAAEQRIQSRVDELKGAEAKVSSSNEQKNEADAARFKGLVTMYEGMKPKDAAKVFDRLEMPVLIEIASQIAPRKMSDIMGLMSAEAAEKLTVELAHRATGDKSASAELPKIEGKMISPGRN